jgi:phosphatidylserine decarboxylase
VFAREGYALIAGAAVLALLLVGAGLALGRWGLFLAAFGLLLFGFTLWFFRDPRRTAPAGADLLLAPADGKVVELVVEHEPLYLRAEAQRVSIFLSPLNVHVNRSPAAGVVEYVRYVPGDYLVAWHPKASEQNERSEIGLRHPSGTPVLFKQIAGAVARRIVYHVGVGDRLAAGERFGIVKFGSRMDVLVPPSVALDVKLGQRVVAGVTVLGRIPPAAVAAASAAEEWAGAEARAAAGREAA